MKKILIAIGYHPVSEKIVKAGCDLAKSLNAEVCLLHVVGDIHYYNLEYPSFLGYAGYNIPPVMQTEPEVRKVGEEFLKEVSSGLGGEVQTAVRSGETSDQILRYAEEWEADIIVLGTHSKGVLEKMFLGSRASAVIDKAKVPIYLVPVKK